jgi:chromosome segregation ATPase
MLKAHKEHLADLQAKDAAATAELSTMREKMTQIKEATGAIEKELESLRKQIENVEKDLRERSRTKTEIISERDKMEARVRELMNKLNIVRGTADVTAVRAGEAGTTTTTTTTTTEAEETTRRRGGKRTRR